MRDARGFADELEGGEREVGEGALLCRLRLRRRRRLLLLRISIFFVVFASGKKRKSLLSFTYIAYGFFKTLSQSFIIYFIYMLTSCWFRWYGGIG